MVKIIPFRAIRPQRDKVHLVATRPIYSYKKNVLKSKLQDNPFTFLHIINPKHEGQRATQPNTPQRFQQVKEGYQQFLNESILFQDQSEHFYIYRQTKNGASFTGIIAGACNQEYRNGTIKKHEETLHHREQLFVDYLDVVGYNAEPILLTHKHNEQIAQKIVLWTQQRPEYEFSTTDRIKHELWIVPQDQNQQLQQLFQSIEALYIADGHHRTASSAGLEDRHTQQQTKKYPNQSAFLSFIIDEQAIQILEFNRLIRSINGLTENELINALSKSFHVQQCPKFQLPQQNHYMTLCVKGSWYELQCKEHILNEQHPVKSLDTEIVTQHILYPILNIQDLKHDRNIAFVGGTTPVKKIAKWIDKKKYELAIFLFPLTIDKIKRVADNQLTMPPKSTWIEPKLRSGLTIYKINE